LGVVLLLVASSLISIGSGSALAQSAAGPEQPPASEAAGHHGGHAQALDARAHRIAKDIAADIERVEP
jgi:hypothetical protein